MCKSVFKDSSLFLLYHVGTTSQIAKIDKLFMMKCLLQGRHLHGTQPGTTEESPTASETEHVRTLRYYLH